MLGTSIYRSPTGSERLRALGGPAVCGLRISNVISFRSALSLQGRSFDSTFGDPQFYTSRVPLTGPSEILDHATVCERGASGPSYSNAGDKAWQSVALSGTQRVRAAISERGAAIC